MCMQVYSQQCARAGYQEAADAGTDQQSRSAVIAQAVVLCLQLSKLIIVEQFKIMDTLTDRINLRCRGRH